MTANLFARLIWRPAALTDIEAFYGEPQDLLGGFVVLLNGAPAGLVGLIRRGSEAELFSDIKPELCPHLQRLPCLRAIKAAMALAHDCPLPVYAETADVEGCRLLERLGFTRSDT